jgi:hypothetical protein
MFPTLHTTAKLKLSEPGDGIQCNVRSWQQGMKIWRGPKMKIWRGLFLTMKSLFWLQTSKSNFHGIWYTRPIYFSVVDHFSVSNKPQFAFLLWKDEEISVWLSNLMDNISQISNIPCCYTSHAAGGDSTKLAPSYTSYPDKCRHFMKLELWINSSNVFL